MLHAIYGQIRKCLLFFRLLCLKLLPNDNCGPKATNIVRLVLSRWLCHVSYHSIKLLISITVTDTKIKAIFGHKC